ncbi:hypothetical protein D9M68_470470 [compost metagenome]
MKAICMAWLAVALAGCTSYGDMPPVQGRAQAPIWQPSCLAFCFSRASAGNTVSAPATATASTRAYRTPEYPACGDSYP